ncbi:MAG: protein kinase [Dokdonella sp.]|uniref:serine/threonine-protein kinase n=1 Tax=Dokdonella sp. TaxID=2291710 RepID=UPI003265588F
MSESSPPATDRFPDTTPLRELFEAALALAPEERVAYLDARCHQPAQRAAVERMLAADVTEDAQVLDRPFNDLLERVGDIETETPAPAAGTRIGPFTLLDQLGEGGSSIVYRAEREHSGVYQQVALKLLRRGLYAEHERRHFRDERRALAQLRHPGIAHLIEGGVTETGVPYIALELIDGTPITEHVRDRSLDLRRRLELFVAVCRAVDAAHRAFIVHRDLKPSNVLVTRDGAVKLLDFGIATLLDRNDTDPTHTLHRAMTPAYAAPEQFSGGQVTTATDVYALGILLCELLTGRRREHGDTRTPSSRVTVGTSAESMPESARTVRRQLRGDLDNIVLKATATEPERRYSYAGEFADDVERYLAGLPVNAHPPSRRYRVRKFIARHRVGVASTALFLLALFAALGVALWQAGVARREAARANTVRDFIEGMFEPIREGVAKGQQPSLTELVDKGAERVTSATTIGAAERVDLLLMFSRLYDFLNERERMQELADRAGTVADSALGSDDPRALDAAVARGTAALRRSDYVAAQNLLGDAEARLRSAHVRGDAWIRVQDGLAAVSNDRGDPVATLAHERAALDARIAAYGVDSEEAAGGASNLAFALDGAGEFAEAVDAYRQAYAEGIKHGSAQFARNAVRLASLGASEMMMGNLGEARVHLRSALAVFDQLGGKPSAGHVQLIQQHCLVELVTGSSIATATCTHAVDLARGADETPGATTGRALRLQALSLMQSGDLDAAHKTLAASRILLAEKAPPTWQGRTDIALGEVLLIEGHASEAATELAIGVHRLGAGYPAYLHNHGLALLALACRSAPGTPACKGDTTGDALRSIDHDAYRWNPLLLSAHVALARIDLADGRADLAAARLQSAIDHAGVAVDPAQPYLLNARLWQAVAETRLHRCDGARHILSAVWPPASGSGVDRNPLLADALAALREAPTCGTPDR